MTAPLRVDPATLQAAAAAQSGVASVVAGLDIGGALAGATDGMANLSSGSACRFAAESFATSADAVHAELATYASHLMAAADAYQHADEEIGGRLGTTLG